VKPSDHEEFFRFPAPEGRSRESTIRLDSEGRFWHDEQLVEREDMNRVFSAWITRHPDDGRFILENGYDWTYFTVEDVPYFVRSLSIDNEDAPKEALANLSDGTSEPLRLESLTLGARDALYCSVKDGAFEARFMPAAQLGLTPLLVEHGLGFALQLNGTVFPIGKREV